MILPEHKAAPSLIVTLTLEEQHQRWFDQLRDLHFPRHANYLQAHLTLFHHVPADVPGLSALLESFARRQSFTLDIAAVCNMGKGVAFGVESPELQAWHHDMQLSLEPWLIAKDRRVLWPHITIQNKVTAFKAKQLSEQLQQSFRPFQVRATGFHTWHYHKQRWEPAKDYPFLP